MKRLIFESGGLVRVVTPVNGVELERVAEVSVPLGVDWRVIDVDELPDRVYWGAWSLSGGGVVVDMVKARGIHRDSLRVLRKPLLDAADVDYLKAVEVGDSVAVAAVVARKQALRDVTKHESIESAQAPEELKLAVPDVLR